jgi:D-arabinose 1-dehydrogenase-like Zn-dependent alcohol dehydrogenase
LHEFYNIKKHLILSITIRRATIDRSTIMGETKTTTTFWGWWLGASVVVALSAIFFSIPHPAFEWDADILPNAQRYMHQPPTNETPLKGMVIAITGATSGIGLELTRTLNKLGATVVAIGRSPKKLNALFDGTSVQTVVADLNDLASVANASHYILEHYDQLDVLINNAGMHTGFPGMWIRPTTHQGYESTFGGTYHNSVGRDMT